MKNKEITIYELMGLVKDGKAPKRIKYNDAIYTLNFGRYYSDIKMNYLFDLFNRNFMDIDIPNLKVEILPEENDEWEDIEEINVDKENCKRFIEYDSETGHHKYTIRLLDEYFSNKINQLIKNQKYLKEKLEEK